MGIGRWRLPRAVVVAMGVALGAKALLLLWVWVLLDLPGSFLYELATAWDGEHYLRIARAGYQYHLAGSGDSPHWAPAYPLLIWLTGGFDASALAVNHIASLVAVGVVAWHWGLRPAAFLALWPPFLVFGSVGYSEGLYLLFAALALAWVERGAHARAGLLAVLAIATRYLGGPALLAAMVPGRGDPRRWWSAGIVALGGAGLWGFLWFQTGSPLGYFEAQRAWGGALAWPWERFVWLMQGWFTNQGGELAPYDFVARDVAYLALAAWGMAVLWSRPERRPSWSYSLVILTLALCVTGTPAAAFPRYALAAFPAIAVVGERLRSWPAWGAYAAVGLSFGANGLVHFLRGYWS